jgi:hypothetical protein
MRLHVARIRATVWFGKSKATDCFAACHGGQPALFLLVGAIGVYWKHDQARLHRHEAAQTTVTTLELLADQAVANAIEAGTIVALDGATEQAEFGNFADKLHRECVLLKCLTHERNDAIIDEAADGVFDHDFVFAEFGADIVEIEWIECFCAHGFLPGIWGLGRRF